MGAAVTRRAALPGPLGLRRRQAACALVAGWAVCTKAQAGLFSALAEVLARQVGRKEAAVGAAGAGVAAHALAADAARAASIDQADQATAKLREALDAWEANPPAQPRAHVAPVDEATVLARYTGPGAGPGLTLPPGRLQLLGTAGKAFGQRPRVVFATTSAKQFGQDFMAGSRHASQRLRALRARRPALVDGWLRTPVAKRVFVIGASQSQAEIVLLRSRLQAEGFNVFFYKFCEDFLNTLCSSQDVGAFFFTAGHVIAVKSPAASASAYIPVELAASQSLLAHGALLIISPDDVARVVTKAAVAVQVIAFDESRISQPPPKKTKP